MSLSFTIQPPFPSKKCAAAIAVRRCICYTLYIVIVSLIFVFYRIKERFNMSVMELLTTRRGQKKLRGQLADLYSCKGHHTTTTPVNTVYSRSTRPVPMAMLAAISKASIIRIVPER